MDDRELLELAARAAGINLITWTDMYDAAEEIGGAFITQPRGEPWNPLTDDGDALRLAVKLNLMIVVRPSDVRCNAWGSTNKRREFLTDSTDPYSATRRAIVRAAAEIGKLTPSAPSTDGGGT